MVYSKCSTKTNCTPPSRKAEDTTIVVTIEAFQATSGAYCLHCIDRNFASCFHVHLKQTRQIYKLTFWVKYSESLGIELAVSDKWHWCCVRVSMDFSCISLDTDTSRLTSPVIYPLNCNSVLLLAAWIMMWQSQIKMCKFKFYHLQSRIVFIKVPYLLTFILHWMRTILGFI